MKSTGVSVRGIAAHMQLSGKSKEALAKVLNMAHKQTFAESMTDENWAKAIIMHMTGRADDPTPLLMSMIRRMRTGRWESTGIPRRIDINRMKPAELQIRACVDTVEKMGAHADLTQAVTLLQDAREKVADYIDLMHPDER